MQRPPRLRALLLGIGLVLAGGMPLQAQQPTAHATATLRIPPRLTYRIEEEPVQGGVAAAVVVTANSGWRLTLRSPGAERVVSGGAGRDQRFVLTPALTAARRAGELEITLAPN